MSNPSGITTDQQLLDVLNNSNQGNGSQYSIIIAKISNDSTAVEVSDQFDSLDTLKQNLGDEPLYIFIKDFNKDPDHYLFISYVPDNSPVRSKMLYASTKNTLLREIGTNILGKQVLATELVDIDDAVTEKEINKEALLTDHEKIELQISQQQRQMKMQSNGHQLVSQTNGTPSQLNFQVMIQGGSLADQLNETNSISFKIDIATERVELASKKTVSTPSNIEITTEHPSYTIYKNGDLAYFIYACPSGSKVKDRMLYASNRSGFLKYLQEDQKISMAKVIEIGEPEELEISLISNSTHEELKQEEDASKELSAKKFDRPKGPNRRRRN